MRLLFFLASTLEKENLLTFLGQGFPMVIEDLLVSAYHFFYFQTMQRVLHYLTKTDKR